MQCWGESTMQQSSECWHQGTRKHWGKMSQWVDGRSSLSTYGVQGGDLWAGAPPVGHLRVRRWRSSLRFTCWKWLPAPRKTSSYKMDEHSEKCGVCRVGCWSVLLMIGTVTQQETTVVPLILHPPLDGALSSQPFHTSSATLTNDVDKTIGPSYLYCFCKA